MASLILVGLCAGWALSTPIGAANDEGAQVLRAVSIVRGQLLGQPLTAATQQTLDEQQLAPYEGCTRWGVGVLGADKQVAAQRCAAPFTVVTVPGSFASIPGSEFCNSFDPWPDNCPVHLDGSDQPTRAITYVGRYPPLYYAIVGLPSLATQNDTAIYAMRLLSGILTASLIGLAIATAVTWSTHRLLLLAVTVVATPLLIVFGSVVNPSGLEMSAALCTWTGVLTLVLDHAERPPRGLVVVCTTTAALFALARPLSVFWLALIALFVVLLCPRAVRSLGADRRVRIGGTIVTGASLLALAWVAWAHSWSVLPVGRRVPGGATLWHSSRLVLGHTDGWYHQFAGSFGWEMANPPLLGVVLLAIALVAVLVVGLVTGERRQLAVLALLGATAVVLPDLLIASQAAKNGIVWQTRDGYPLLCGVVLVAGSIGRLPPWRSVARLEGSKMRAVRGFVVLVACCVAGTQFADLYWVIRRFRVGLWGPLDPLVQVKGGYSPPVPTALLLIGGFLLCVAYGWLIVTLDSRGGPAPRITEHDGVRTSASNISNDNVGRGRAWWSRGLASACPVIGLIADKRPEHEERSDAQGDLLEHHGSDRFVKPALRGIDRRSRCAPDDQPDPDDQHVGQHPKERADEQVDLAQGCSSDPGSHKGERHTDQPLARGERRDLRPDLARHGTTVAIRVERFRSEAKPLKNKGGPHDGPAPENFVVARNRGPSFPRRDGRRARR